MQGEHESQLGGLTQEATSWREELAATKERLHTVERSGSGELARLRAEHDVLKQETEAAIASQDHLSTQLAQKEQEAKQVQVSLCCRG